LRAGAHGRDDGQAQPLGDGAADGGDAGGDHPEAGGGGCPPSPAQPPGGLAGPVARSKASHREGRADEGHTTSSAELRSDIPSRESGGGVARPASTGTRVSMTLSSTVSGRPIKSHRALPSNRRG